jgi:hypothetical protein
LIAIIDGLKGFPEAINAVFPETRRSSLYLRLASGSAAASSRRFPRRSISSGTSPEPMCHYNEVTKVAEVHASSIRENQPI